MVTFRQELGSAVATRCAFCDNVVTASHFQETCQCSQLWYAVLHAPMAPDLRRIVLAWSVSLPTCWGVLVRWGGAYLGSLSGCQAYGGPDLHFFLVLPLKVKYN